MVPDALFELSLCRYAPVFAGLDDAWRALDRLEAFVREERSRNLATGQIDFPVQMRGEVWLETDSVIEPFVTIEGIVVIGRNVRVGSGSRLRGPLLISDGCVIGGGVELKASILLEGARVPHFNYVGDSILGREVNLGAGAKLSNYRFDEGEIRGGRTKLGALIGDRCKLGCNAVTLPGAILGPGTWIGPNVTVGGVVPPASRIDRTPTR